MKENSTYFCSVSSKKSNDDVAGTASYFKHLLLIEYRGIFKNKAFDESEIDSNTKDIIQNFIKIKPDTRLLLIKKANQSNDRKLSLYGASNYNYNHIKINQYKDISIGLLNDLFININKTKDHIKPVFLICTNGKKDKCCAKFGLPIWKNFNAINENVWQCTHLGGDRFAPTALVLPSFSTYGRIQSDEVSTIVSNEKEGKVYLKKLRGCSLYNLYEQAADIFIRKTNNHIEKINQVQIISSNKVADNIFEVYLKLKQPDKQVQLTVEKKPNNHFDYLTCRATKKSFSFGYTITSVVEKPF